MAQLVRNAPRAIVPFAIVCALLVAPVLITMLGGDGLPPDIAPRAGWLLAQALGGFAVACGLAIGAWRLGTRRDRKWLRQPILIRLRTSSFEPRGSARTSTPR